MELYKKKVIDAKTVEIELKAPYSKNYLDGNLTGIIFNKNNKISIGDTISTEIETVTRKYQSIYKVNYLEMYKNMLFIHEFKSNMSTKYILPLLGFNKDQMLIGLGLINCYLGHYNYKHDPGEYIYLIYKHSPTKFYQIFSDAIKKQRNFSYMEKDKDNRFDCFVFKTNPLFVEDVNILLTGKYSKISEDAKTKILKYHGSLHQDNELNQILYKGELRKTQLEKTLNCKIPDNIDYDEMPLLVNEVWNYSKNLK
jgi:hypothetical protein